MFAKLAYSELNLNQSLYHYTSAEAFKVIAETGQMRLSRADQTNDPFEFVLVRDFVIGFLDAMANDSAEMNDKIFWTRLLTSYRTVSSPESFYISCFSLRKDSIPMWRLYAGEGEGIVFGLRQRAFSAFDARLTRVDYLKDFEPLFDHILEYTRKSNGEYIDAPIDTDGVPLVVRLLEATVSSKKAHWDYEEEIRLGFSYNADQYEPIKEHVDEAIFDRLSRYKPTDIELSEDRQFLFQSFGLRKNKTVDRSKAIECLILGPSCKWSPEEANDFLLDQGYQNFEVLRSDVVWR